MEPCEGYIAGGHRKMLGTGWKQKELENIIAETVRDEKAAKRLERYDGIEM